MIDRTPVNTLAVMPTFLRDTPDLDMTKTALSGLMATTPWTEVCVIDDGSPNKPLVEELGRWLDGAPPGYEFIAKSENEGFSRTVNIGLKRALREEKHAVLVNADVEFIQVEWLDELLATDALVTGAKLLYANGCIQHAGIFFSHLHRVFDHIYRHAPEDLPESNQPRTCPVTGALHLIDHEALRTIGLYDEQFRMGHEDVDYCLRVFLAGEVCRYVPTAVAVHHESVFRGRPSPTVEAWQQESWLHFMKKYAETNFNRFIPSII